MDPDTLSELKFYLNQIYLILKPVILCILLSVLWVKLTTPQAAYFETGVGKESRAAPDIYNGGAAAAVGADQGDAGQSVITALIIMAQIVVVTIIVFLLFKYNQMKVSSCFSILS
jgi:presenilin 1